MPQSIEKKEELACDGDGAVAGLRDDVGDEIGEAPAVEGVGGQFSHVQAPNQFQIPGNLNVRELYISNFKKSLCPHMNYSAGPRDQKV